MLDSASGAECELPTSSFPDLPVQPGRDRQLLTLAVVLGMCMAALEAELAKLDPQVMQLEGIFKAVKAARASW